MRSHHAHYIDQGRPDLLPRTEGQNVRLGIGRAVKRDAVLVKVSTDEGLTGWGEAHHGRCPGAIAKLIDTTISELVVGMDAMNVVGVWQRVYQMQLASHGMGYAAAMALSGLDLALWDIRAKAAGWPLYKLLGGASKPIKAYAAAFRSATSRRNRWRRKPSAMSRKAIAP
jgi:L-alanine-DL-glutamate epimerase-like enolase superfamily enzyme